MTHYVITTDGTVRSYTKASLATAMGLQLNAASLQAGGAQVAFIATDDDLSQIPTATLVVLHNLIRPEKPVTRFSDRATADKRMKGVLEVLAKPGETPAPVEGEQASTPQDATDSLNAEDSEMATKKSARKRVAKKTPVRATGERAGRPSAFAGKVIRKVATENPRREGTFGYKSWELIKNGMSYEKYVEAGGRRQDLAWDLAHGYVKLEKA